MVDAYTNALRAIEPMKNEIWERLCDDFIYRFRSADAVCIMEEICGISHKTAQCYWNYLSRYWLISGNSDLVKLRNGLYGWLPIEDREK